MTTEFIQIQNNYDYALNRTINVLNNGGLFVFPTDTVYGLGCIFDNEESVKKIYELKGRDFDKPLAAYFSSVNMVENYILKQDDVFYNICEKYIPGAITIVTKKNDIIPDFVTSYDKTIGIRIPKNKFILDLIERLGIPFVGTSANISNNPSAKNAKEAFEIFKNKIELVLEDDGSNLGMESTVLSVVDKQIKILRQGALEIIL